MKDTGMYLGDDELKMNYNYIYHLSKTHFEHFYTLSSFSFDYFKKFYNPYRMLGPTTND